MVDISATLNKRIAALKKAKAQQSYSQAGFSIETIQKSLKAAHILDDKGQVATLVKAQ